MTATVEHARRALELAFDDDHVVRAGAAGFLGITFWTGGDLGAAHRAWSECVGGLERAEHVADALGATLALGDICMVQGRLSDALRAYEHALALRQAAETGSRTGSLIEILILEAVAAADGGDSASALAARWSRR